MLDAAFLEFYMERAGRVQIILCGDFAQLPPVPERQGSLDDPAVLERCKKAATGDAWKTTPFGLNETSGHHAFQTAFWRRARPTVVLLKGSHRSHDPVLLDGLADMRLGRGDTPAIRRLLEATRDPVDASDGVLPTRLFSLKADVHRHNATELARLDGPLHHFRATDAVSAVAGTAREDLQSDPFFRDCQATGILALKIGCQVMLVRNEEAGQTPRLVNGSRGVVIRFKEPHGDAKRPKNGAATEYPVVRFACGREELIEPAKFEKELYLRGTLTRHQVQRPCLYRRDPP